MELYNSYKVLIEIYLQTIEVKNTLKVFLDTGAISRRTVEKEVTEPVTYD